jgi:hypothetical protein
MAGPPPNRVISPERRALSQLRTPLTAGEFAVIEFFDRTLPEGWEIYVQPHMNGLRPDIVLLHPEAFTHSNELCSGAHGFCEILWGGQQGRRGLAIQCCLARDREIVEDIAVLWLEGRRHRHHRFDKPGTVRTLSSKTPFTPQHARMESVNQVVMSLSHRRRHAVTLPPSTQVYLCL